MARHVLASPLCVKQLPYFFCSINYFVHLLSRADGNKFCFPILFENGRNYQTQKQKCLQSARTVSGVYLFSPAEEKFVSGLILMIIIISAFLLERVRCVIITPLYQMGMWVAWQ